MGIVAFVVKIHFVSLENKNEKNPTYIQLSMQLSGN